MLVVLSDPYPMQGPGLELLTMKEHLQSAFHYIGFAAGYRSKKQKREYLRQLQSGFLVLRVQSASRESEGWYHLALHYQRPWRPTWVCMIRDPARCGFSIFWDASDLIQRKLWVAPEIHHV